MTLVAYLSHPIGPTNDVTEMESHHDNLDNASHWLRYLINNTQWAIMCPWLAYTTSVGNEIYGPRALTDQIALLERCDILAQIGGWLSPHMNIELNHAKRAGIPIIDLSDLGDRPQKDSGEFDALVRARTKATSSLPKRRVWLPPLDVHDVDTLRAAQVVLQADPYSGAARILIQRIVAAAMRR